MKYFLVLFLFSTSAMAAESFTMARMMKFKTCTKAGKCTGFVKMEGLADAVEIPLEPLNAKGVKGGKDGWAKSKANMSGVVFNTEIHVIEYPKGSKSSHFIYAMLRSGPTLKRQGKVRKLSVKDLTEFKELTITDEPIEFEGGTLQAQLVISPSVGP